MHTRVQLRRQIRTKRRELTPHERVRLSREIAGHLLRSRLFINSRRIAAYLAMQGEVDLSPVIHRATQMCKAIYLPALSPLSDQRLWFVAFHAGTKLTPNRLGIPEPLKRHRETVKPTQLDVVLTPLVGFDNQGNRLGMGGGFYDRTFSFLNHRRHWHRPALIGCAYAFQRVDELIHYPWDVRLDGVVTEEGLQMFDGRGRR